MKTTGHYGALPAEWEAFAALAKPDLLPYLADPNVKMDARSTILAGNKTPGYIVPGTGLGVGMKAWPSHVANDDNINAWRTEPAHGICLICRNFRAVDIDIPDRVLAEQVEGFVREYLGVPGLMMPLRTRSDSGKRMLLYRIADVDEQLRKFAIPVADGKGIIEFLFDKQQTVVAGRHPSGALYEWPEGLPTRESTPVVDLDQVRGLIREVKAEFGAANFNREWGETRVPIARKHGKPVHEIATNDPVVTYLIERDWLVDYADDGGIYVRCPWEHEHESETKYDAAKYFPAGLNRADAGFNCFHAHCIGRDHHNFLDEIGYTAAEFPIVSTPKHVDTRPRFKMHPRTGVVEPSLDNIVMALEWPEGSKIDVIYDSFRDAVMYRIGDRKWTELTDEAYTEIRLQLTTVGIEDNINKQHVVDAVAYVARRRAHDSAQEWLAAKKWDGVPRIDTFHTDVLKLDDTAYHQAVCQYLWTALAGRIIEPGVKADMVPVITGPQGLRKSTLVERLAPTPNEYTAITLTERDADLARLLRGKMVAEWDELRGLGTREEEAIKGWLTHRTDEWIPKFKEFGTVRLRRFLVLGTNNRGRYLTDPTGSRRYLPLNVTRVIDTDYVTEFRNQLWAEAAVMFRKHGVMFQRADALAGPARKAAELVEVWTPAIGRWLGDQGTDDFTSLDILNKAVLVPVSQATRLNQDRVRRAMLSLGWYETPDGRWRSDLA